MPLAPRRAGRTDLSDLDSLVSLGWDDVWAEEFRREAPDGSRPGRVVRVDGISFLVSDGVTEVVTTARPLPAVGDWIATERDDEGGQHVVTRLTRRKALVRADARRRQVLAANVDVVFVTVALDRADPLVDIEAALAVALAGGTEAVVVLTKTDVNDDPSAVAAAIATRAPEVPVVPTSAHTGAGVEEISRLLQPNRTGVLLGPSGTGKSTLANKLLGSELMFTQEIRSDGAGRHTTTARRLMVLPDGGVLIDIPGVRSYGLADAAEGVARLYADLEQVAAKCRFADCSHDGDPECALDAAISDGTVAADRVGTWRRLSAETELGRSENPGRTP